MEMGGGVVAQDKEQRRLVAEKGVRSGGGKEHRGHLNRLAPRLGLLPDIATTTSPRRRAATLPSLSLLLMMVVMLLTIAVIVQVLQLGFLWEAQHRMGLEGHRPVRGLKVGSMDAIPLLVAAAWLSLGVPYYWTSPLTASSRSSHFARHGIAFYLLLIWRFGLDFLGL